MYVLWLKKSLLFFFSLTHTLIISFKDSNTLLSHLCFILHAHLSFLAALSFLFCGNPCCYSPPCVPSKQKSFFFLSLGFTLYFPSPHREGLWAKAKAKAYKFFVALSIYKTLLLFPLGLGIHYLFNFSFFN